MKILTVNKPVQTKECKEVEHSVICETMSDDGSLHISRLIPTWCVKTEIIREKDGGFRKFIEKKEKELSTNKKMIAAEVEGIYLYAIEALNQKKAGEEKDEIIYYIRYDYIKPLK